MNGLTTQTMVEIPNTHESEEPPVPIWHRRQRDGEPPNIVIEPPTPNALLPSVQPGLTEHTFPSAHTDSVVIEMGSAGSVGYVSSVESVLEDSVHSDRSNDARNMSCRVCFEEKGYGDMGHPCSCTRPICHVCYTRWYHTRFHAWYNGDRTRDVPMSTIKACEICRQFYSYLPRDQPRITIQNGTMGIEGFIVEEPIICTLSRHDAIKGMLVLLGTALFAFGAAGVSVEYLSYSITGVFSIIYNVAFYRFYRRTPHRTFYIHFCFKTAIDLTAIGVGHCFGYIAVTLWNNNAGTVIAEPFTSFSFLLGTGFMAIIILISLALATMLKKIRTCTCRP